MVSSSLQGMTRLGTEAPTAGNSLSADQVKAQEAHLHLTRTFLPKRSLRMTSIMLGSAARILRLESILHDGYLLRSGKMIEKCSLHSQDVTVGNV